MGIDRRQTMGALLALAATPLLGNELSRALSGARASPWLIEPLVWHRYERRGVFTITHLASGLTYHRDRLYGSRRPYSFQYLMICPDDLDFDYELGQSLFPVVELVGEQAASWLAEHPGTDAIYFRFGSSNPTGAIIEAAPPRVNAKRIQASV
ncbi:MAG: hypothetical protein ACLQFI_03695 [Methylocella sp.]